ncbi:hypothetical protein MYX07_01250 [Patescibacteria group bacterium AH-259-L07]|nr:hypothetical protein [Patescibacteria group bacterium AH-259-L07]
MFEKLTPKEGGNLSAEQNQSEVYHPKKENDNQEKIPTTENRLGKIFRSTTNGGGNALIEGENGIMIRIADIEKLSLENESLNSSARYFDAAQKLPPRRSKKTKPYKYPEEIEKSIDISKNVGKIKGELLKSLILSNLQLSRAITEYGVKVSVNTEKMVYPKLRLKV